MLLQDLAASALNKNKTKDSILERAFANIKNWQSQNREKAQSVQLGEPFRVASEFGQRRIVEPVQQIPSNLKTITSNQASPLEKGVAGLSTIGALSPGPEDVIIAAYDALKAKKAGKDPAKGFTGEEFTGLGEAALGQNKMAGLLNLAEIPLMIAAMGGMGRGSLENISNIRKADEIAKQADNFVDVAKAQQPGFEKMISDFATKNNLDFSIGPVKSRGRILEKAVKEEGSNLSNIKDANRAVVFIKDFSNSHDELINTAKRFFGDSVDRVKIGKDEPLFKKSIVNVIGDSGQPTEVQFTTKALWDAKIESGDKLYHKWRSFGDSPKFAQQRKELYNEMKELYTNALNNG